MRVSPVPSGGHSENTHIWGPLASGDSSAFLFIGIASGMACLILPVKLICAFLPV